MKKRATPRPPDKTPLSQSARPTPSHNDIKSLPGALPQSAEPGRRTETILFGLFLLTLLTPLIYSSTTFFGFITGRTIYFRVLVALLTLTALYNRRLLTQPLTRLQISVLLFGFVLASADALGIDPTNSFLSGYSRMEGFLAYSHYALYFMVLARAGFAKQRWHIALLVSVVVAALVVVYGAMQPSGWQVEHYRLVATIGNSSYLGLYLLLHMFLAVYLFGQFPAVGRLPKAAMLAVLGGILFWGLVSSGTRSAVLGLGAGMVVLAIGWTALRFGLSRRPLLIGLLALVVVVGILVSVRNTALVKQIPYLQRLTSVSNSDNTFRPRYLNWRMALSGIAERPLLGWGQENYSYGFARYYNPTLLLDGNETYDRVHNLLLDTGFSAGILGLLAYGFIWLCLLRRLQQNPLLTALDRVVLLALLVAYGTFNLLNFDSLVSAQVFFFVLALIDTASPVTTAAQSRSGTLWAIRFAGGVCVVILGFYTVSAWQTFRQIDRQSQLPTAHMQAEAIETTYRQARVGQLEVADVLVSLATSVLPNPNVPGEDKQFCYDRAISALITERQKHPFNGRLLVRQAGLYVTYKQLKEASALYDTLLRTDAQRQPRLWFQAGTVNLQDKQPELARRQFQEAYRRQPKWELPLLYEALTYTVQADTARARSIMERVTTPTLAENFALVKSVYLMNRDTTGLLTRLNHIGYEDRVHLPMAFFQEWILLAFDAHQNDIVSSALRSFIHSDGIYVYEPKADAMIGRARRGIRPEQIDKLLGN